MTAPGVEPGGDPSAGLGHMLGSTHHLQVNLSTTMPTGTINPKYSSETLTRGIRVRVSPFFLADHSDPSAGKWVFAYKVRIANEGDLRARLLTRRWVITDAHGQAKLVEGEGVVGQNPDLAPGQSFEYSSFCPLETPWGTMEGAYQFYDERGDAFDVGIARFYLVSEPSEAPVNA